MIHTSFRLMEKGLRNDTHFPFYVYDIPCHAGKNAIHPHWNEETEILLAGSDGIIEIDAEEYLYKAGDILFINGEQLHKATAHTDGNFFVVVFPYDFLEFKYSDRCQTDILDRLKAGQMRFPPLLSKSNPAYEEVRRCLKDIIAVYFSNTVGREIKMKACMYDILFWCYTHQVFERVDTPDIARQAQSLTYVKAAMAYMDANLASPITMDDLADQVGLHKNYLSRLFREITGTTPILYLRQIRLEHAAELLQTGLTVTQAAFSSGFNNISYFIKSFSDMYGVSPKQYAKER